ncbi:hypothetical protein [Nonomuraea africana]|uniref:Tryptophan-rich sensory protein n=1 Tax=Nonomuraea africana TaxID=46171 RepID=A0ABR9KJB1_9ACTN|nr:hypothetical protein [Nonomuraea africana]MBE1561866.1 hypothetical protein [Nonomuraea africana]
MTANANVRGRSGWDPWRRCAAIGTATLIPTTVLAWIYVLSTAEFSRCLTYGEQCAPAADVLLPIAWWTFWGSVAAGVGALVLPKRWRVMTWLRPVLAVAQLLLQVATFAAVVGSA